MTRPWDRQRRETTRAWHAFQAYRDAGRDRTLPQVARDLGGSPGQLRQVETWSGANGWVARVAAWDSHIDQAVQARHIDEVAKAKANMVRIANANFSVSAKILQAVDKNPEGQTASGAASLQRAAADLLSRGLDLPTRHEVGGIPDGPAIRVRIVIAEPEAEPLKPGDPSVAPGSA